MGDAEKALAEHKRRFPDTVFGAEERGLSLLVSCSNGLNATNRAAAERFVQAAPTSPLSEPIKKQCLK
jgi:hypothetical protein